MEFENSNLNVLAVLRAILTETRTILNKTKCL